MAKLIRCPHCLDLIHLTDAVKQCHCGAVGGSRTGDNLYSTWGHPEGFDVEDELLINPRIRASIVSRNNKNLIPLGVASQNTA